MYLIKIVRTYFPKGTNGVIYYNDKEVCKCVELPWFDNRPRISCIPEGNYTVFIRETDAFGIHLFIPCVPERNYILIHPANVYIKELQGCIAPVTRHTGRGIGVNSATAMRKLMDTVYKDIMDAKPVRLQITSETQAGENAIIEQRMAA